MQPTVEVLVSDDCPHVERTVRAVANVVSRIVPGAEVQKRVVGGGHLPSGLVFPGSPTVLVDGEDIAAQTGERTGPGPACRLYDGTGVPPDWMIEAALLRSTMPSDVLFLCVANSARSQMAEGIARSLAPEGVRVGSPGSEPSAVRPLAVRALGEIGVDISQNRSTGVDEVPGLPDAVITLCAEELCPVWMEPAHRLHWPLPDPAAVEGEEERQLGAYREVRDELRRRPSLLFRPLLEF